MNNKKLSLVLLEHFPTHLDTMEVKSPSWIEKLKEVIKTIARQTKNLFKSLGRGLISIFAYLIEANRRSIEIHKKVRQGQEKYFNNYGVHIRGLL
jgi:hypothetical protein